MKYKEVKRIYFSFFIFCILFFLVLSKAFYVQVITSKKLIAYSNSQFLRQSTLYPKRGNIYDRNGSPLGLNIQTYSIFTIPKHHKGQMENYKKLTNVVPELKFKNIKKKILKRNRYTWLARKIQLTAKQIELINSIEGIYIEPEPSRFYPNHELLSQTLGFVGVDNVGLSGIEFKYNKELQGEAQVIKYLQDAKGRPIKFTSSSIQKVNKSQDIYLTIEKDLQAVAEKYLRDAVEESMALKGGIGVMDVSSGEILAMANYPTFDPNFLRREDSNHRKLSFVSDPFEPGSIFKIFTVASALENKVVTPKTHYFCEYGKLKIEDYVINEAETHEKFEWLSVTDIIKFSSNVGITKIAFDLTYPTLKKTLLKLGIGRKTGIEIPGESRGIFTAKDNVGPLSLSNISFGQGVAVTGVQILSSFATIANGGIYVRPTIVRNKKGNETSKERIFSEDVAKKLTKMLTKVVDEGTGSNAKIPYFRIAGKTGTAQKPSSAGGYEGYVSGFVGFPVNVEKRFVIFVYVDGPKSKEYYGNDVAAPVFKKVAQYILYKDKKYNNLTFDKSILQKNVVDTVKVKEASWRLMGSGKIPNFIGLDKISSISLARKFGLQLKHSGIGIVTSQSPMAGEEIQDENRAIELKHIPPKYD